MRLLVDTQLIFWWLSDSARVPREARKLIEKSQDDILVSRVSAWELAIKVNDRKLHLELPLFSEEVTQLGFLWLPIEDHHIQTVATLPRYADHKDPFDRLLIAQSLSEPLILLTTDSKLSRYGSTVRVV